MITQIKIGDIVADLELKDIKNIHLSVYPPNGKVRISAPLNMDVDRIRIYTISKLEWIREQQKKFLEQERETQREYIERESHYLWGARYLLHINESEKPAGVKLASKSIDLFISPDTSQIKKQKLLEEWYRQQIKQEASPLIAKWEKIIGVKAQKVFFQKMKTRWGSCTPSSQYIRLNTELAKKPRPCLEYIIIHELVHLLEPTHNARFINYMDQYLPQWKQIKDELNRFPLKHENWQY